MNQIYNPDKSISPIPGMYLVPIGMCQPKNLAQRGILSIRDNKTACVVHR